MYYFLSVLFHADCRCAGAVQATATCVPGGGCTTDPDPYHQEVSAFTSMGFCYYIFVYSGTGNVRPLQ